MQAFKRKLNDELRILSNNELNELNQNEISLFLAKLRLKKPNLADLTDQKNLTFNGIYSENQLTIAGLMLFGLYPQASFPQLCITAVVVPGLEVSSSHLA